EQQIPQHRRDDAITEIFRQAFDCSSRYAVRVKAHRIAAHNVLDRRLARREPASLKRRSDGGDMLVEAALGDEDGNQQGFDRAAEQIAMAQLFDHKPQRCRAADQESYRDDAAAAARGLTAGLAVELVVKEPDRPAGEYDGVADITKDRRHIAEQSVERETGDEQQQSILTPWRDHVLICRRGSARDKQ